MTLHVTDFVDILRTNNACGQRSTTAHFEPIAHPRVTIEKSPEGKESIVVQSKGAPLCFEFTIEPGPDGKKYYPRGIAFLNIGLTRDREYKEPRIARPGDFPFDELRFSNEGRTLTIPDAFKDPGKNDQYEFSLLIQKEDGSIGIIDPPIGHDY